MKQYHKSIDSLRILSILAVLAIHTSTRVLEAGGFDLTRFPLAIFLNQIGRFAVPLFFMISGFVLELNAGEKIDYTYFLKRRFGRIALPFVFWSLIYYFFVYSSNRDSLTKVLLTGNASYQLYFIPTLCIYYLTFPVLHKILKFAAKVWLLIFLGGLEGYFLYQDYFVKPYDFSDPIRITILSFFFFIAGMVASHYKEKINIFIHRWKHFLVPATILSGIYVYWEGLSGYKVSGNYFDFYSTWRTSVLVYSVLVGVTFFHLFEKNNEKNNLQFKLVEKLSNLSFFVFFVHVAVLEFVWSSFGKTLFGVFGGTLAGKILFDPIFFGIVALVSFTLAFVFHKIPRLYRLTG
jgi:surface polysaccharide O-acyltransferase-like enzyme